MSEEPVPGADKPSDWIVRWAHLIPRGGKVLDLASGHGRHARYLAGLGHVVVACDRDRKALESLNGVGRVEQVCADLEDGGPWPFRHGEFEGVVVTNYLHRPLYPHISSSIAAGGVLLYETFLLGNERYGKPSNPKFLLQRDELLGAFGPDFVIAGFEQGRLETARSALVQRLCAVRSDTLDHDLEPRDQPDSVRILG